MRLLMLAVSVTLAGCTTFAENGAVLPAEQPNQVVVVPTAAGPLSDCAWNEIERRQPTLVQRSQNAEGHTVIRMQEPGARHWEMEIRPIDAASSRVTFRTVTVVWSPTYWWDMIGDARRACRIGS